MGKKGLWRGRSTLERAALVFLVLVVVGVVAAAVSSPSEPGNPAVYATFED